MSEAYQHISERGCGSESPPDADNNMAITQIQITIILLKTRDSLPAV